MSQKEPRRDLINGVVDPTVFMRRHGAVIAHAIAPERASNRMDIKVLKYGRDSLALVAKIGAEKRFVKYYDPQNADTVASYRRERDALQVMAGTGLCPQLQHYSDAGQILIT